MESSDDFLLEIEKYEREIRAYLESHQTIVDEANSKSEEAAVNINS